MSNERSLSAFFADSAKRPENVKAVISDRFTDEKGNPIEWEFRQVPSSEVKGLRNMCYITVDGRRVMDEETFGARCLALSVVYPNLNDGDLLSSYGARDAAGLLNAMLYMNELNKVSEVFQKMNIPEGESFRAQVETVKNS